MLKPSEPLSALGGLLWEPLGRVLGRDGSEARSGEVR